METPYGPWPMGRIWSGKMAAISTRWPKSYENLGVLWLQQFILRVRWFFMRAVHSYLKVYAVKLSWPVINVDGSAWHHEHHTGVYGCVIQVGVDHGIWQYPSKCQVWFLFKGTTIRIYDWCFSPAAQQVKKGKTRFVPSQFIGSPVQQHFQEDDQGIRVGGDTLRVKIWCKSQPAAQGPLVHIPCLGNTHLNCFGDIAIIDCDNPQETGKTTTNNDQPGCSNG